MIVHFEVFGTIEAATAAVLDYQRQQLNVRLVKGAELIQFSKDTVPQNSPWVSANGTSWFAVIATDESFTVPPPLPAAPPL